jgi:hypothetical protein
VRQGPLSGCHGRLVLGWERMGECEARELQDRTVAGADPPSKGQAWLGRVVRLARLPMMMASVRLGGGGHGDGQALSADGGEGQCACAVCESMYSLYCTRTWGGRWTAGRWRVFNRAQRASHRGVGERKWSMGKGVVGRAERTNEVDDGDPLLGYSWSSLFVVAQQADPPGPPSLKLSAEILRTRRAEQRCSDEVS